MHSQKEFQQLTLAKKYLLLKNDGQYLASRFYESYHVHLYAYRFFYVEVWCSIGLKQICWIEVVYNPDTVQTYVDRIDVFKELGLND